MSRDRPVSKDYYEILGVQRTASQDDIKKAFRKLAAEHHPDHGGNEAKFKEVNTAHQVLTDEVKKARYDAFGDENATAPPPRPRPHARPASNVRIDLDDHFNDIFRSVHDPFGPFAGGSVADFSKKAKPAPSPGADITIKVSVPMAEALAGTKKEVRFDRGDIRPCTKRCSGGLRTTCLTCGGSGRVMDMVGLTPSMRQCRSCAGSGSVPLATCPNCKGTGSEPTPRELTVTIPKGLRSGQNMRVKGLGRNGSPPGDLMIIVEIVDSPLWWARGEDLFTTVEVGVRDLMKGGTVAFTVPDGRTISVNVPPGGGSSKVPRAWKNPAGVDGDLVVLFKIQAGGGSSPRAERLMRELLEELEGPGRRQ